MPARENSTDSSAKSSISELCRDYDIIDIAQVRICKESESLKIEIDNVSMGIFMVLFSCRGASFRIFHYSDEAFFRISTSRQKRQRLCHYVNIGVIGFALHRIEFTILKWPNK